MNRCSPNANVTHGVLLWADFLHQHKSSGKWQSLEELVTVLLGHRGSAQQELTPVHMARLKSFAQMLFKCLKIALPLCDGPYQGVDFYKSAGDGALAMELTTYTVKDI